MHILKDLFLYQLQSSNAYAYSDATAATLGSADLIQVAKGSSAEAEIAIEPVELVAAGFDQYSAVVGKMGAKASLKFLMNPASTGGTVIPQWAKVMQGSCDYSLATTTAGTAASQFALAPISSPTVSGILDHYTGDLASGASLKSRYYNLKGNFKIGMEANKVPTIDFSLDGAFYSEVDGTQPDIASSKVRENPFALKGATVVVIGSTAYPVSSFAFESGESVVNRNDISQTNGAGQSDITDRKIKVSFKCYAVKHATVDPLTSLLNDTEGTLWVTWGTSTKAIRIGGTYFQITERKKADENGITVFDIKGQLNRNDFLIGINY
jgi:hypothetical protein